MEWLQIFVGSVVVIFFLYKYGTRNQRYWKKLGVAQGYPMPFIGDNYQMYLGLWDSLDAATYLYNKFKGERVAGFYALNEQILLIRDPELIKQIMVDDSKYFINRFDWLKQSDPFIDEKWRDLRSVMTTIFTAAKMKNMFQFMEKCCEKSLESIKSKLDKESTGKGQNILEMEFNDFFCRLGTDFVGSTAFGIEVDSFEHPDNEFFKVGFSLMNVFSIKNFPKLLVISSFPSIAKALNISLLGNKIHDFFTSLVTDTIRRREKHKIVRRDAIHILNEARKGNDADVNDKFTKGKLPDLKDEDIAAQLISFFFGGIDMMATVLCFLCYELALNPGIQEKLRIEIDEMIEKEKGITYDGAVHQLPYLGMVIQETLRKWPPTPHSDRQVSEAYTLPRTESTPEITLKRGDTVMIPIGAIHNDPEYFPNPRKFDPERFYSANIKPFTFIPFGAGLRHCIGTRYALTGIKVAMIHLLKNYFIVTTEKTQIPIRLKKGSVFLKAEKGFWLGLKPREKKSFPN